jgi:hypothetical protein
MTRHVRAGLILIVGLTSLGESRAAPPGPATNGPEICDFSVEAGGKSGMVLLRWTGGTPPFIVMRSDRESFSNDADLVMVESRAPNRLVGVSERTGTRYPYWYQAFDRNSVPQAFSVKPLKFKKGQTVTVRGIGFSKDCAQNRVLVAGTAADDVRGCSGSGLKFRAPSDADASAITFEGPHGNGGVGDQQRCKGVLQHPLTWE